MLTLSAYVSTSLDINKSRILEGFRKSCCSTAAILLSCFTQLFKVYIYKDIEDGLNLIFARYLKGTGPG